MQLCSCCCCCHLPAAAADNNLESMFSEELKRRGLDSIDDLGGWPSPADEGEQAAAGNKVVIVGGLISDLQQTFMPAAGMQQL